MINMMYNRVNILDQGAFAYKIKGNVIVKNVAVEQESLLFNSSSRGEQSES